MKSSTTERRSSRLGFRFRLQTVFVLITAFTIALGLVFQEVNREQRKKRLAADVQRLGGYVRFNSPRMKKNKATGVVNGWLRIFLGDGYFTEVSSVGLKQRSAEDVKMLLAFPEVRHLRLSGAEVTDDSLRSLSGLTQLEDLELDGATLSEKGLEPLAELPSLSSLHLANCVLSDDSLKPLTKSPSLRSVEFDHCLPSEVSLKTMTELAHLRSVSFANCPLTDSQLRSMYGALTTVTLGLNMTHVTEAGMLAIREANPTWSIRFHDQSSVEASNPDYQNYLPSVQAMPRVTKLAYKSSLTSSVTLAVLENASSLNELHLLRCRLTDGDLRHLLPLQNLKSLSITAIPITDEGLRALEGLTKLEHLHLKDTNVEGAGLRALPSSIRQLSLKFPEITGQTIGNIAKLTSLESLAVEDARVSDQAIEDLAKMSSLRRLFLLKSTISPSALARLQQALPDCEIIIY